MRERIMGKKSYNFPAKSCRFDGIVLYFRCRTASQRSASVPPPWFYCRGGGYLQQYRARELAHVEMVSAILYQLTRNLSVKEIKEKGFDQYFVDHTTGIYPQAASGVPFSAETLASTGDVFADLHEDLAAEQKARLSYDNILRLVDDPDVRDAIKFLREREIVHFQRFGEAIRIVQDKLDSKNFYAFNPAFDK